MFIRLCWWISHRCARHREFIKAIHYPLFIRVAISARRFHLCAKTTDAAIRQKTFRGIPRSGSRVGQISPVIYSMRVGDVSPSFMVILAVLCHGGIRDEGKTRVERGLKRGKGTLDWRTLRYGGTINIIYFRPKDIYTREICLLRTNIQIV